MSNDDDSEDVKVRTSVYLPKKLLQEVEERRGRLLYKSLNEYVVAVLAIDVRDRPDHKMIRSETPIPTSKDDGKERVIDLKRPGSGGATRKKRSAD